MDIHFDLFRAALKLAMKNIWLLISLSLLSGLSLAAPTFTLSEVNGDACVPGVIYDKLVTRDQIIKGKFPSHGLTFIHDNCSAGDELVIGLNGTAHKLRRPLRQDFSSDIDNGVPFHGDGIVVRIVRKSLIAKIEDNDETCGGEWWKVQVTVTVGKFKRVLNGTLEYSC